MKRGQKATRSPIGVFDSGLGGLTVVKALMKTLPYEDVVYFGDTARVPYGTKSKESIIRFSKENASILLKHKVKLIVVACNSSSSYALKALRRAVKVPVVGVIEPGVKKALAVTRQKKVGVIATPATVKSGSYVKVVRSMSRGVKVSSQACPLFVPLVEEGWFARKVTRDVAQEYLKNLKSKHVDTLILGCTHYPCDAFGHSQRSDNMLKGVLRKVMGPQVELVDSAWEVAREVKTLLDELGLVSLNKRKANYRFLVSDDPQRFQRLAKRFLGYNIGKVKKI